MGFDSLLLMSISFTATQRPIRELGVFSLSQPIREQVSLYLEQAENSALDLRPISCVHPHVTAFHQGNSVASRKKLLPLLKDFLWRGGQELVVPPTPVNSLVEGCPLDRGLSPTELQTRLNQDWTRT
ncbi:exopolyphosphatase PRUNE1-like [Boleophthalmus pectinirostris]|uniref:exopolyphosphatase PRUNE1-like n=1 Tax=Boleophthalmus pectinirostris TaxID=150288 RepID=UPI00242E39E2|nr:exopolyphosphatase PRUNE1-like [Boleophthalmus pectinirostris]